jgi:hypothetical protein
MSNKPTNLTLPIIILSSTLLCGALLVVLYIKTPETEVIEKTLYMILASAILPSGFLWGLEYFTMRRQDELKRDELDCHCSANITSCRALVEYNNIYHAVSRHGLVSISTERDELVERVLANFLSHEKATPHDDPNPPVKLAHQEVIIIGSTLKGLLVQNYFEGWVRDAITAGISLKFIFTHWDYIGYRESQEDKKNGTIISELCQNISQLLAWGVPESSIRLAYGTPTLFLLIAGSDMIINPYTFTRESYRSMTVHIKNPDPSNPQGPNDSIWFQYYRNHYLTVWEPQPFINYVQINPKKKDQLISCELPSDWKAQIELCIADYQKEILEKTAGRTA